MTKTTILIANRIIRRRVYLVIHALFIVMTKYTFTAKSIYVRKNTPSRMLSGKTIVLLLKLFNRNSEITDVFGKTVDNTVCRN